MRLLLAIPHCFGSGAKGRYGSMRADRPARIDALGKCISALHRLFGGTPYLTNLAKPITTPANKKTASQVDVIVCTAKDQHVLDDLPISQGAYVHHPTDCDPMFLGYECHAVLREHLDRYDFFCYLEDDLILHDPWFFVKLRCFTEQDGSGSLLQPNRFEIAKDALARKAYIDGDLADKVTSRYQDINDQPQVLVPLMGVRVPCHRQRNPHSGCFFLNPQQMEHWSKRPYFLDRESTFFSPLESAATLGIMRTFRIYKPAPSVANFLEIEHYGDAWMKRIAQRDGQRRNSRSADPSGPESL